MQGENWLWISELAPKAPETAKGYPNNFQQLLLTSHLILPSVEELSHFLQWNELYTLQTCTMHKKLFSVTKGNYVKVTLKFKFRILLDYSSLILCLLSPTTLITIKNTGDRRKGNRKPNQWDWIHFKLVNIILLLPSVQITQLTQIIKLKMTINFIN